MSDETTTPTPDAAEAPSFQDMAPDMETAPTDPAPAPDAPAEPPAPAPRALARKAERDALKARSRLEKAEAAEARAKAMHDEVQSLRGLLEKLQSDDPFVRAEAARVDVEALARHQIENDTPEARTKKLVAEQLAAEEAKRAEAHSQRVRAHQEQSEQDFVREASSNATIKALLEADAEDGEPLVSRTELIAQAYRVAVKLNSDLASKGAGRPCTNAEIVAALESKYRKRFAVQAAPEPAPGKPASKPVNGAAGARNAAAPKAPPRTPQEIRARLAELMESN